MDTATRDYLRGFTILAVVLLIAFSFVINPMPWSPMGKAEPSPQSSVAEPRLDLAKT